MKKVRPYVDGLRDQFRSILSVRDGSYSIKAVNAILDGQPSQEIRRLVPLTELRQAGAFFTGANLAYRTVRKMASTITGDSIVVDPACGAGDLLLAASELLPVAKSLTDTLELWGRHLKGRDTIPEFIDIAKLRLALAAIRRGTEFSRFGPSSLGRLLPDIRCGCGLSDGELLSSASHIVINPPFTMVARPPIHDWARGVINSAALFIENCVLHSRSSTQLAAILPDVLRSGTRYRKWREFVDSRCKIQAMELCGQFDRWADVDVFILNCSLAEHLSNQRHGSWQRANERSLCRVSDYFDVSVGPVVPYRDPHRGRWNPYITARTLPTWETLSDIPHHRRYRGRVFDPPFVAIRRTSRPGDRFRAVGTVVAGLRPVAVENHLLVLSPKDGTLKACLSLQGLLRNPETSQWLDQRIRCRHLTVSAVMNIPCWAATQKNRR